MSASETTARAKFYVVGGTLRRDAPSYVVREADRRLYSLLCQSEVCYALTPRQMGKSSLMVRTAARLRDDHVWVAVLDLTGLGQNLNPDQWYNGLLERVGQQLQLEDELEDYWTSHPHLGPLQRWTGAIREVVLESRAGQVVIFIDEIDAVRSLTFSTDELFAGIREFYNRRTQDTELNRLTFCLLGVATPSDLIRDTRTTPFNIGKRIELADFTEEEAAPLAEGLGREQKEGEQLLRRVLSWTGGHPYLTQRLCQAVADASANSLAAVDQICHELFLTHRARERDDNLLFVRERMLRNETDVAGVLSLYGKIRSGKRVRDDEINPLITVLRLAGIVRVEHGHLRVRNRLYAEVFDKAWATANLPGAEIRRQRAAYWRGLKVAGAISVAITSLIVGYGVVRDFRTSTTPALVYEPPKPPAFWVSFTAQSFPASNIGALLVKAGGDRISVFVNGTQYGRTDTGGQLQVPALPAGDYEIRLEKDGFQSVSQRAQIVGQKETHLVFKLSPKTQVSIENAMLIEQTPAGTRVSLDGKPIGSTGIDGSLTVKVGPGEHTITLEREGYLSKTLKQEFRSGNTLVDGRLTPDTEARDWEALSGASDLNALEAFLARYPGGRFAPQARLRTEQLEWTKIKDSNDPVPLDAFLKKYPRGQYAKQATAVADQLQQEDIEWHTVQTAKDASAMQAFLDKHPHTRHQQEAAAAILIFRDQKAILGLLKDYEDSYNHQDLKRLLQLWPFCPNEVQTLLRTKFKGAQSGTLSLAAIGDPTVIGEIASLMVSRTRQTASASTSGNVSFKFRKQNEHWVIESGSF